MFLGDIFFSVIIPVFNRPDEVEELLASLSNQKCKNFETIIVEDGSNIPCEQIVEKYKKEIAISYFVKPNSGPGDTRNFGAKQAKGNYFVFFDSDCIIPENYFCEVNKVLQTDFVEAYGGADAAHHSFTPVQKAISYAMTSFFTTGGIRGGKTFNPKKFHPRSFNMGFSREVFELTKGFGTMRFGEDIDMSLRIKEAGFRTTLIKNAFVYHKRRTDFWKFFKQVHNSGIARINLYKRHSKSLKIVHFLPAFFTLGLFLLLIALFFVPILALSPVFLFSLLIFFDALLIKKNTFEVAYLAIQASFVQLIGYGTGFLKGFWRRIILRKPEFHSFTRNFYK
ncbi:MAG: glycosyltransferase [Thermonemataceae bacterium]|nr:glycosyltransferase [Thermonemataceae bacterium]